MLSNTEVIKTVATEIFDHHDTKMKT